MHRVALRRRPAAAKTFAARSLQALTCANVKDASRPAGSHQTSAAASGVVAARSSTTSKAKLKPAGTSTR